MAKNTNVQRRKGQENKAFYFFVAIILVLIVAIVGGIFLIRTTRDTATLPDEIQDLSSIQDDWIVIDADNTTGTRLHHPGSFAIPQGYTKSSFYTYEGNVTQDFYLVADDPDADVAIVYVYGMPEVTAEEYIERCQEMYTDALNDGVSATVGTPFTATIASETAQCLYLSYTTAEGDYGCLISSFNAPDNVCITAMLSGAYTTAENVQTQEQLLNEAQTLLAGLTIIR